MPAGGWLCPILVLERASCHHPLQAGGEAPGDFIVSVLVVWIGKIKASFMLLFFFKSYFQPLYTGTTT
jgi:hypothetical protein